MVERIQRRRAKGWRMPPNTVYVGRGSRWGNPFVVGQAYRRRRMADGGGERVGIVVDRAHAVRLFRRFTARETAYRVEIYRLSGKNLACWCPLDQPCHADVLLKLANCPTTPRARPAATGRADIADGSDV